MERQSYNFFDEISVKTLFSFVYIDVMTDELLYRYFRNEVSDHEISQIEKWLAADPSHQKEFDAAHMLFNVMALQETGYEERKDVLSSPFQDTLGNGASSSSIRGSRRRLHFVLRSVSVAAVAVLAVIAAGYAGVRLGQNNAYERMSAKSNVINVPAGDKMSISLQDGTEIQLNGGSTLEYPVLFAQSDRRIRISGEAYLDVAKDPEHPFIVETYASEIEVLGTKFNVLADESNKLFSTVLVSGKVKVTTVGRGTDEYEQVILNPDEKAMIVDNHLVVSKVISGDEVSWKDGYINLRGVGFEELMSRFERMYGTDILIARDDIPEVGYLSGKIKVSEGIDFALHLLQEGCDFTYEKDERTGSIIIN